MKTFYHTNIGDVRVLQTHRPGSSIVEKGDDFGSKLLCFPRNLDKSNITRTIDAMQINLVLPRIMSHHEVVI